MRSQSARPLILSFAAAIATFDLVVLLPGNPYVSRAGFVVMVVIQALLVRFLLRRSQGAWFLALLGSGLYVVSFVLLGGPYETTFTISAFLALVQVGFLCTPPNQPRLTCGLEKGSFRSGH